MTTIRNMPPAVAAQKYRKGKLFSGDNTHQPKISAFPAVCLVMQNTAPPPVEEYAEWLELQFLDNRSRNARVGSRAEMTAEKLRRMVIMKRGGYGLTQIARSAGYKQAASAKFWLDRLPEGLKP